MLDPDETILVLARICGDRDDFGRTTLQKLAYLATERFAWPAIGHHAYYYGPFSRQVEQLTARLVGCGLVREERSDLGFISPSGFPARRYAYRLTASGELYADKVASLHPKAVADLRGFVDEVVGIFGSLDQQLLSQAAKVHFVLKSKAAALTRTQIAVEAKRLGWTLNNEAVNQVSELLARLDMVETSG